MAVVNPPGWLQNAGATHQAFAMRSYIGAFAGPAKSANSLIAAGGVHMNLGFSLQVTQTGSPTMAVIIRSGVAEIPGTEAGTQGTYGVMNDADFTASVTAAHATLARIDIVCFKVEDSQYSGANNLGSLVVVAGTPSGSPVAPAAPANSITLAQIAVGAAVTSITNANITDVRTYLHTTAKPPVVNAYAASTTWNKPQGASHVFIRVWGGGGAGGGAAAAASGQHSMGAGGGAGGYCEAWRDASGLGATVAVTVGSGGTAVSGAAGGDGTSSSFGAIVIATGGTGGQSQASTAAASGIIGGVGGVGNTGDVTGIVGDDGNFGFGSTNLASGGKGGSTSVGGGGRGASPTTSGTQQGGDGGGNYGGGGGGGVSTSTGSAVTGGNGAQGLVVVISFFN